MNDMPPINPDPFAPLSPSSSIPPLDPAPEWVPQIPAPAEPPEASAIRNRKYGTASARWVYRNVNGEPLCAVVRFDLADGGKEILPYTFGCLTTANKAPGEPKIVNGWHFKAPVAPRPLYGLDRLAAQPDAPVLVVEGEKVADAACALFRAHVPVTSLGGSNAAGKGDWSPLAGRKVTIWPDNDDAGAVYAAAVARLAKEAGARAVHIVTVPEGWPPRWDLADMLPEGVSVDRLAELLNGAPEAVPADGLRWVTDWPRGFVMGKRGLLFVPEPSRKNDGEPEAVFVAAPFDVLGVARDLRGEAWGLVLSWRDSDNRAHQWAIPRRLVHRPGNEIAEELEDKGLRCGPDMRAHDLLKRFISGVNSTRHLQSVSRAGWHQHGEVPVFVLPGGEAFGRDADEVVLQAEAAPIGDAFLPAGTLAGWHSLAALAVGNSRLLLACSTAFAGPLLDVLGEPSGGLHLVGGTRTGKTSAMLLAASVWGPPTSAGQIRTWRGTANGLEGTAAGASDTLLILDEMGQAAAHEVGDVVYMLGNQAGKQRAGRTGAARRPQTWRLPFLSTGELTLAAKMGEAGKRGLAGLESRLITIPADAGAGLGVFENLHGRPHGAAFADALRDMAMAQHGTAGRAFLARLAQERADDPQALRSILDKLRDGFVRRHVAAGATGQVRSVAGRFALIGAAGELARDYGVAPWPEGTAMEAAAVCFRAWLDERGGTGAAEDTAAIAQVRAFIELHGESRFTLLPGMGQNDPAAPEGSKTINRAGYRRRVNDGVEERWEYLILPEAWKTEVCKGINPSLTAELLAKRGWLVGWTKQHPATTVRIPGEGTPRVYRLSGAILGDMEASDGE